MNTDPIIIIDDDEGSCELTRLAFEQLVMENELIFFHDSLKFIDYIKAETGGTFFIICDINMPKIDGLELKKILDEDERTRFKAIPFIFLTTTAAPKSVMKAYSRCAHGVFIKPDTVQELSDMFQIITMYWKQSLHPN
jgi:CheY-like chemotaxis protein